MTTPDPDSDPNTGTSVARRSPGLAVVGIIALCVAGWGLAGGPTLPDVHLLPWILVTVGLLVGISLVTSGFRNRS